MNNIYLRALEAKQANRGKPVITKFTELHKADQENYMYAVVLRLSGGWIYSGSAIYHRKAGIRAEFALHTDGISRVVIKHKFFIEVYETYLNPDDMARNLVILAAKYSMVEV